MYHCSVHANEEATQDQRRTHLKGLEGIEPDIHAGLEIVPDPTGSTGKSHNSLCFG
jgi:hypothetical protein